MVLPRSAVLRGTIRSFSFKRIGTQARTTLRGAGRRTYASEHGATKSSDIPWLIGSIVVTVPAAGWLWQQGPTKSDHGHGHESHEEEHEEAAEEEPKEEESKEEQSEAESKDESEGESKDEDKEESSEGGEEEKSESSEKETTDGAPSDEKTRSTEKKGEKDAQGDVSNSNHPSMGDPEKSKKSEGMPETAKIHGTVDTSQRPVKGQK